MSTPTPEQAFADYQAKLRAFHKKNGRTERHNTTVTAIRPAVFCGSCGK